MIDSNILLGALAAFTPLTLLLTMVVALRWQRALVSASPAPLEESLVVLIPARNEAQRLPATLPRKSDATTVAAQV